MFQINASRTIFNLFFFSIVGTTALIFISKIDINLKFEFFLYLLTFFISSFFAYLIFISTPKKLASSPKLFSDNTIIVMCILTIGSYIHSAGGLQGVSRIWLEINSSRGIPEILTANISQIFYLVSIYAIISKQFITNKIRYFYWAIFFCLIFISLSRTKAFILPLILPYIFFNIERHGGNVVKSMYSNTMYLIAIPFFYFIARWFRWLGDLSTLTFNDMAQKSVSAFNAGFESDLSDHSSKIFQIYSEQDKLWGDTYLLAFDRTFFFNTLMIENPIYIYSKHIDLNFTEARASIHPTLMVDSFANFGYFGVLIVFPFLIFLYFALSILRSEQRLFFIFVCCYTIPLIVRGSVYYGIIYTVLLTIGGIILLRLFKGQNTNYAK